MTGDAPDRIGLAARRSAEDRLAIEYETGDLVDQMVILHEMLRELRDIRHILEFETSLRWKRRR